MVSAAPKISDKIDSSIKPLVTKTPPIVVSACLITPSICSFFIFFIYFLLFIYIIFIFVKIIKMKSYKLKLFNFLGTPVSLNIFFLLVFVFFSIQISIAIFISILIHEMAHAWMANKKGYVVYGIEIDLFKGSAYIQPPNQRDSIPITFAGPLSNLLLFVISFLIHQISNNEFIYSLMIVNLLLFIFNILPIYPMDGGHLVRDILMLNMDRKRGKLLSIKISLITSILLFIFTIYFNYIIMMFFSIYFIYESYKSLKNERK